MSGVSFPPMAKERGSWSGLENIPDAWLLMALPRLTSSRGPGPKIVGRSGPVAGLTRPEPEAGSRSVGSWGPETADSCTATVSTCRFSGDPPTRFRHGTDCPVTAIPRTARRTAHATSCLRAMKLWAMALGPDGWIEGMGMDGLPLF